LYSPLISLKNEFHFFPNDQKKIKKGRKTRACIYGDIKVISRFSRFTSHPRFITNASENWFLSLPFPLRLYQQKTLFSFSKSGAEDLHGSNDNEPSEFFFRTRISRRSSVPGPK
jgi:hypothetical protein